MTAPARGRGGVCPKQEPGDEARPVAPSASRLIGVRFLLEPTHALALGLGMGYAPIAPGTAGTVLGVGLYLTLRQAPLWLYLLLVVILTLIAIGACHKTATDLRVHDHPAIVLDEVVGFLVAMIGAPTGWGWLALGFVLFRAFDIFKPWPIRIIDTRIGGGLGIVLDDVLAGLYAWMLIQLTVYSLA